MNKYNEKKHQPRKRRRLDHLENHANNLRCLSGTVQAHELQMEWIKEDRFQLFMFQQCV